MPKTKISFLLKDRDFWLRVGVLVGFCVLIGLILPKHYFLDLNYELNKVWTQPDLKAPFEFSKLKPQETLEREQQQAMSRVRPIFKLDSSASFNATRSVMGWFDALESDLMQQPTDSITVADIRGQVIARYGVDPEAIARESRDKKDWVERTEGDALRVMNELYAFGYVPGIPSQVTGELVSLQEGPNVAVIMPKNQLKTVSQIDDFVNRNLPQGTDLQRETVSRILKSEMTPNYTYSDSLTRLTRELARKSVSPVYGKVARGEVIIRKDQPVGTEEAILLESFMRAREQKYKSSNFFRTFLGQFVILILLSVLFGLTIRNYWPRIYYKNRKLLLVAFLFLAVQLMVVLVLNLSLATRDIFDVSYIYLVPFCMVPIILSNFFEFRFAYFSNTMLALMVGVVVPNGLEFIVVQMVAGTVAVFSLKRLRRRSDFFLPLVFVLLAYAGSFIIYNFYIREDLSSIQYNNLILFVLNALLTFITYPLVYAVEKGFKLTSDLTYIELLDTNHPLLKELAHKAPGTFQHSLQVANLAEAAVDRVGGDALLVRVGALYHDIGKMNAPDYFIENLTGEISPHKNLSFESSAKIIIKHVTDGVHMAREANLPDAIVEFIATHHGTSRTEYFYRMAQKENPDREIDELVFRYPGPVPFSKETAILMIADSCEAACRSLKNPGPTEIEKLVENIVNSKVKQEQLENANITFKDLLNIKKVVYEQLVHIYHGRIEYPEEQEKKKEQPEK